MLRKLIVAFALLSLVSCGDDIEQRYKDANAKLPPPQMPAGVVSGGTTQHPGETRPTKWATNARGTRLTYAENATNTLHQIVGTGDPSKREYTVDGGPTVFITKQEENEIKIKSPDGTLRWKIKVDGNTIKIADNEQNANAITLTTRDNETFATAPDGQTLGSTLFKNGQNTTTDAAGKVLSVMPSKALHPPYAITAITSIPVPDKYVIQLELLDLLP